MMKRFLFFLALVFLMLKAYSQSSPTNINNTSPPSANSFSLGQYDVNYYSGQVTYSAHIDKLAVSQLTIPVDISYSSSGIKVQDLDGPLGTAWRLNAGGVISRFVVGLPDETANGYCGSNNIGNNSYSTLTSNYFTNITNGTWDAEPDKFYFSFLNFSGTFELDQNGNPVLKSSYGLKVIYSPFNRSTGRMTGGNEDWIIRDMAGNQYYFGDGATESNTVTTHGLAKNTTQTFISGWYISKIITVDGQIINFQYQTFPSYTFTNYLNVYLPLLSVSGECSTTSHITNSWNENTDTSMPAPIYLSKITSGVNELDFLYTQSNTATPYLSEVDAIQNGIREHRFKLNYITFTSDDGTYTTRQCLSNIQQLSVQNSTVLTLYSFGYNSTQNLPARNSLKTDYWGYYNSNLGASNIEGYNNGDKTPDPVKTAANILVSATNIYGGTTKFTYQQNDYGSGSSILLTGGLRIKNITTSANGVNTENKTFNYTDPTTGSSSGQIYSSPNNYSLGIDYWIIAGSNVCVVGDTYYYSESLSSLFDLNGTQTGYSYVTVTNADGSSIRYKFTNFSDYPDVSNKKLFYNNTENDGSAVEATPQFPQTSYAFARGKVLSEEDIDNNQNVVKKTINTFFLSAPIADVIDIKAYAERYINGTVAYYYNSRSDFSTQDLLLSSKTEASNFYSNGTLSGTSTTIENYTYNVFSGNNFLASKTRTLSNGNTEKITYRYPFNVLTSIPSTTVTTGLPVSYMAQNFMLLQPSEVVTSVINATTGTEKVLSVTLTRYGAAASGAVKPSSTYRLKASQSLLKSNYQSYNVTPGSGSEIETIDPNLEQVQLITHYDSHGNVTETDNPYTTDGQSAYLWGYNQNYLIAEVKNAAANEFFYDSFEESSLSNVIAGGAHSGTHFYSGAIYSPGWVIPDSKSYIISYWYRSAGVWKYSGIQSYTGSSMTLNLGDAYDDVRICPVNALLTSYTYEPLIGMTSSENSYGQSTSYEYDDYKRLVNIRDMHGNIIKNYNYYFQGQ